MANRLATPVDVPASAKTALSMEPTPILSKDSGGAEYFARAQKLFSGLGDEIGGLADKAAAVEGAKEGYERGLDPEFRPTNGFSIRDQAIDKTGIATYELTQKTEIAKRADAIAQKYPNDPRAAQAAFEQLGKEYSEGSFPEVRPIFAANIEHYRLATVRAATRRLESENTAARKTALEDNLQTRLSAIDRTSYAIGLDEEAAKTAAAQLEDLRRDLSAATERRDMTPKAAERVMAVAEGSIAQAKIIGAFDRLPSMAAREEFLGDFGRRYSQSEGDFAKLDPKAAHSVQSAMIARLKSEGVEAGQQGAAITKELDRIDTNAGAGMPATREQMVQLQTRAASVADPALSARLERSRAILDLAQTGSKMTPGELEGVVANIDATIAEKGASEDAVALRKTASSLLNTMREELKRDPLGWANRAGLVSAPPIDFGKDDALLQMRARAPQAEAIARYYNLKEPVYLHAGERAMLARISAQGGEQLLGTAKSIVEGFGPAAAPKVLAEIGQNAPVLAHTGALLRSNGSENFTLDVAEGLQLRNEETKPAGKRTIELPNWIKQPPDKMLTAQRGELQDVYGDAFALAPDSARAAEASARSAFNARALRHGHNPMLDTPESKSAFDRTLQEAAGARFTPDGTQFGGVTSYKPGWFSGTRKVLVPNTVRADSFRDVILSIRDEDLNSLPAPPQSPGGKAYRARDLQEAVPVAVSGGYRFALGDPASDNPKWIRGADGKAFVLDIDALPLRQRVPGAFLGGR
jgi:hypothetical protein